MMARSPQVLDLICEERAHTSSERANMSRTEIAPSTDPQLQTRGRKRRTAGESDHGERDRTPRRRGRGLIRDQRQRRRFRSLKLRYDL